MFFLLFMVVLFVPFVVFGRSSPVSGFSVRSSGWGSLAAALVVSLLPLRGSAGWSPCGGHRLFFSSPFVDKNRLYVDFICIYADIFVTL